MTDAELKEVSREQFFRVLYADKRDIMPRIVNSQWPYISEWRNQKSMARELFGRSEGSGESARYFLKGDA